MRTNVCAVFRDDKASEAGAVLEKANFELIQGGGSAKDNAVKAVAIAEDILFDFGDRVRNDDIP